MSTYFVSAIDPATREVVVIREIEAADFMDAVEITAQLGREAMERPDAEPRITGVTEMPPLAGSSVLARAAQIAGGAQP